MGEYAYCGSERVKLGTCEDLFYLTPYRVDAAMAVDIAEAVLEIGRERDRQKALGASPSFPWYLRVATRVLDGYGLKLGIPA